MSHHRLKPHAVCAVDVAAATRLWDELPGAMDEAADLVVEAVDELLAEFGGERLTAAAGHVAARFAQVPTALDWAEALHDRLPELDWPMTLLEQPEAAVVEADGAVVFRGLRVSVGVEFGLYEERVTWADGEVIAAGGAVEAAARLARQAPEGTISVGPQAADRVADRLPGAESDRLQRWESAGAVTLLGRGPDDRDAPGGLSSAARRSNLPDPSGAFVGRAGEFGAIADWFEQGRRLVALWGSAGVGKSRLTVEFARRWLASHAEQRAQAWLCDLSQADEQLDALVAIARTVGVQIPRSEAAAEIERRLIAALAERGPLLLLLDNTEQLGPRFVQTLASWVEQTPNLSVLRTCQRRPEEQAANVEVVALGPACARALFEDRLAQPRELPAAQRARQVDVDACGGLPLALELTAGAMRVDSPIAPGPADLSGALDEALAGSWKMLRSPQKAALVACAAFTTTFTTEAARAIIAAVCPEESRATDLLETLRNASLVHRDDRRRLTLLEPVRQFVVARAPQRLVTAAEAAHLEYFARFARRLDDGLKGDQEPAWVERGRQSVDNLYRALETRPGDDNLSERVTILEALATLDWRIGPLGGLLEHLDEAAAAAGDDDPAIRSRVLATRAETLLWMGRYDDAEEVFRSGRELADQLDDERLEAIMLAGEGFSMGMLGREQEALPLVREAARRLHDCDDYEVIAVLTKAAVIVRNRNHLQEAVDYLHRALAQASNRQNCFGQASVRLLLGTTLRYEQRWREAVRCLQASIELFKAIGDRRGELVAYHELATCQVELGEFDAAERCFAEAMPLAAAIGEREYSLLFWLGRGRSRFDRREYARAESDLLEAALLVEEIGHVHLKTQTLMYLATTYALLERTSEARHYFERVEDLFDETEATRDRPLFEVLYGYLQAAKARDASAAGDSGLADELARSAYARTQVDSDIDARGPRHARQEAERLREHLDALVADGALPSDAAPDSALLEVCRQLRWFRVDGGERVDISRRGAIRRILEALVERRLQAPGEAIDVHQLVEVGWPDEVLTPESGTQRIYMTISRMRGLGLEDVLETLDEGYRLDPTYTPCWVDS